MTLIWRIPICKITNFWNLCLSMFYDWWNRTSRFTPKIRYRYVGGFVCHTQRPGYLVHQWLEWLLLSHFNVIPKLRLHLVKWSVTLGSFLNISTTRRADRRLYIAEIAYVQKGSLTKIKALLNQVWVTFSFKRIWNCIYKRGIIRWPKWSHTRGFLVKWSFQLGECFIMVVSTSQASTYRTWLIFFTL